MVQAFTTVLDKAALLLNSIVSLKLFYPFLTRTLCLELTTLPLKSCKLLPFLSHLTSGQIPKRKVRECESGKKCTKNCNGEE